MSRNHFGAIGLTVRKTFAFSGRAPRMEAWAYLLAASVLAALLANVASWVLEGSVRGWTSLAIGLACAIPAPALCVRRLHDFGRSGWWSLGLVVGALRSVGLDALHLAFGWTTRAAFENALIWVDWAIFPAFGLVYVALLAWPGAKGANRFGAAPR